MRLYTNSQFMNSLKKNNIDTPDVTYLYLLHARTNAPLHAYAVAFLRSFFFALLAVERE